MDTKPTKGFGAKKGGPKPPEKPTTLSEDFKKVFLAEVGRTAAEKWFRGLGASEIATKLDGIMTKFFAGKSDETWETLSFLVSVLPVALIAEAVVSAINPQVRRLPILQMFALERLLEGAMSGFVAGLKEYRDKKAVEPAFASLNDEQRKVELEKTLSGKLETEMAEEVKAGEIKPADKKEAPKAEEKPIKRLSYFGALGVWLESQVPDTREAFAAAFRDAENSLRDPETGEPAFAMLMAEAGETFEPAEIGAVFSSDERGFGPTLLALLVSKQRKPSLGESLAGAAAKFMAGEEVAGRSSPISDEAQAEARAKAERAAAQAAEYGARVDAHLRERESFLGWMFSPVVRLFRWLVAKVTSRREAAKAARVKAGETAGRLPAGTEPNGSALPEKT